MSAVHPIVRAKRSKPYDEYPDLTCRDASASGPDRLDIPACFWSVRDGEFVSDLEPSWHRRTLRPLAPYLGWTLTPVARWRVQVGPDELVLFGPDGQRNVYTRAR